MREPVRRSGHHHVQIAARARARPGEQRYSDTNELPSVALTTRFLALCQQYGSKQLAVRIVASGRSAGTPGLPQNNDWAAWTSNEMRAAVEHLGRKLHT